VANDCASAVERERNVKMIYALLFLILFAILFPKALRFLFALLFIGGLVALGEVHAEPAIDPHTPDDAIICSVDAAIQLT
jgi:hypothetical protein